MYLVCTKKYEFYKMYSFFMSLTFETNFWFLLHKYKKNIVELLSTNYNVQTHK